MKNLGFAMILVVTSLGACNDHDDCTPESVTTNFTEGREIVTVFNAASNSNIYKVENGNNTVFEYTNAKAQCDNAYDDEKVRKFTFEVNTEAVQFRFTDKEVKLTNCYFEDVGGWARGIYEIESGLIEGVKISDGKWRVNVSVLTVPKFPDEKPERIEFKEVFIK
ncbi:hypothetical protein [Pontibacter fetidus]|nr:hypothetical protein [Pontibacter fetidus]